MFALEKSYGSKLTITNTIFKNFYYPMGLITNAYNVYNRDFLYHSFYNQLDCTKINTNLGPKTIGTCWSLTI